MLIIVFGINDLEQNIVYSRHFLDLEPLFLEPINSTTVGIYIGSNLSELQTFIDFDLEFRCLRIEKRILLDRATFLIYKSYLGAFFLLPHFLIIIKDADYSILRSVHLIKSTAQKKNQLFDYFFELINQPF